jgi:hypothetical protein
MHLHSFKANLGICVNIFLNIPLQLAEYLARASSIAVDFRIPNTLEIISAMVMY